MCVHLKSPIRLLAGLLDFYRIGTKSAGGLSAQSRSVLPPVANLRSSVSVSTVGHCWEVAERHLENGYFVNGTSCATILLPFFSH